MSSALSFYIMTFKSNKWNIPKEGRTKGVREEVDFEMLCTYKLLIQEFEQFDEEGADSSEQEEDIDDEEEDLDPRLMLPKPENARSLNT